MAIFEVSLGLAFGYSQERIFSDYNVAEGLLMIFGMILMLFAPALAAKAHGFSSHSANNSLQARRS
jgi:hypothetical protein